MDLHPTPLCCRQVLPLPTFCGDIGNMIGGTSHPTAIRHHRGGVYSFKIAAGVSLNSATQQQTLSADGIGSTQQQQQQQQGFHCRNTPPTRKLTPETATSSTSTTTADGSDSTSHQQQGCHRTGDSASLSSASPARSRKETWSAPTAVGQLPPQHQQKQNTSMTVRRDAATKTRKEWTSNSDTTDSHVQFYSEGGVDNQGQHTEDREAMSHHPQAISHRPPPRGDYGKRSASDGHRLPPRRVIYSGRPEMDR